LSIRAATPDDIPRLVELGVRFMRESGYSEHLAINEAAQGALAAMLIDAPHGALFVAQEAGEIIGMIGVIATHHPHSGEPVMSELFWYVLPRARGCGVRLLLKAEGWARGMGVKKSLVVSPSAIVSDLYRRMGYNRLEEQFIKTL
jgi:GNAT superfamily N-acetyltransferase